MQIPFVICLLLVGVRLQAPSDILVRTSKGAILGKHVNLGNDQEQLYYGEADIFLGVPYAKPPVGELRFKVNIKRFYLITALSSATN